MVITIRYIFSRRGFSRNSKDCCDWKQKKRRISNLVAILVIKTGWSLEYIYSLEDSVAYGLIDAINEVEGGKKQKDTSRKPIPASEFNKMLKHG